MRIILVCVFIAVLIITIAWYYIEMIFGEYAISNLINCKQMGIKRLYLGANLESIGKHIINAKQIRIFGISPRNVFNDKRLEFAQALLDNKTTIRILMPEPEITHSDKQDEPCVNLFIRDFAEMELSKERYAGIINDIREVEDLLFDCIDSAQAKAGINGVIGKVVIAYYSTQFRTFMILCDDDWGLVNLTLPPTRMAQSSTFEMVPAENGALSHCQEYFEKAWSIIEKRKKVYELLPGKKKVISEK